MRRALVLAVVRAAERTNLPQLRASDLSTAKLRLSGRTVQIGDLATFDPDAGGTSPWPFVTLGLIAIGAVAFLVARRSSAREEDLQVIVHRADGTL